MQERVAAPDRRSGTDRRESMQYRLILGNKVYSSWSLRGWLLMEAFGIEFEEQVIAMRSDDFARFQAEYHPARQVPTLVAEGDSRPLLIWDSLAIAEFVHERHPDTGIWPAELGARAAARSLAAEMHSGFSAIRSTMPMNIRRQYSSFSPGNEAKAEIERLCALWNWSLSTWSNGGPYLFGDQFCAADAFFAPVASRFKTYGILLDSISDAYCKALLAHPSVIKFFEDAKKESWVIEKNEFDFA